jgi:DNA mismatch repair protein MutL
LDFEQDNTFANLPSFYKKPEAPTVTFKTIESRMNDMPVSGTKSGGTDTIDATFHRQQRAFERSGITEDDVHSNDALTEGSVPFQIHNQYVVTQIKSGFIVIDQQAAHERILYEKYLHQLQQKKPHTQQQLFPHTLQLSGADHALLTSLLPDLFNMGFDIQPFGGDTFVVHGVPVEFENGDIHQVVEELLEQCKEDRGTLKLSRHETIARSLARTNCIKRGQRLDERGMRHLADQMFACSTPFTSPFGQLTFVTFTLEALARQFQKNAD